MAPKVPDIILTCASCHLQTMAKGGDMTGWRAIQLDPEDNCLLWYCGKEACQGAYGGAHAEALRRWS